MNKSIENLFKTILSLKNIKEAERFFGDLLTKAEITEFSARWTAAQMLSSGETYETIAKSTGLSSRTIARISKWLKKGKGGYKLLLKRTKHE